MNKKIFLISSILLIFTAISCKQSNQKTANSVPATSTVAEKENVVENQKKNSAAQILAKTEVPVLCYHRISDGNKGDYTVSPATFNAHVKIPVSYTHLTLPTNREV